MICARFPVVPVKVWKYGPCLWNMHWNWNQDAHRRSPALCKYIHFISVCYVSLWTDWGFFFRSVWALFLLVHLRYKIVNFDTLLCGGVNIRCLFVSIIFQSHQDFIKERETQNPLGGPTITQCHMVNKDLKLRYQSLPSPQSALPWDIYINLRSTYCEETREPHYIFYIDRYIFFVTSLHCRWSHLPQWSQGCTQCKQVSQFLSLLSSSHALIYVGFSYALIM